MSDKAVSSKSVSNKSVSSVDNRGSVGNSDRVGNSMVGNGSSVDKRGSVGNSVVGNGVGNSVVGHGVVGNGDVGGVAEHDVLGGGEELGSGGGRGHEGEESEGLKISQIPFLLGHFCHVVPIWNQF